jgi:hypothetical protein
MHSSLLGGLAFGRYQVAHGLCLGQVELAIQEGSLGELSGTGRNGTTFYTEVYDSLQNITGSMARYLYYVLTSIGMRIAKEGHDYFIYQLSAARYDPAKVQGVAGLLAQRLALK